MPAIGASTTGEPIWCGPIARPVPSMAAGAGAVAVMRPFSQVPRACPHRAPTPALVCRSAAGRAREPRICTYLRLGDAGGGWPAAGGPPGRSGGEVAALGQLEVRL